MTIRSLIVPVFLLLASALQAADTAPPDPSTALWYEQPAKSWAHDALPIGNGRLGAMVFGRVGHERIALNEESVWAGARVNWNREGANKNLPKIRELLLQGKNDEAEALVNQTFTCTGGGSRSGNWGCYQELGNLDIIWRSDVPSLPLNNWKYTMITTPGIKDHRKQWQEVQKKVAEAVKAEFDDSTWKDYVIADGKPAKGYRKFQNGDRAVLRHRLMLTEKQLNELGMLRMGNAARSGGVYVNGQKVGDLAGWKASGHEMFSSNISKHLKVGENVIAIYCTQYRRRGQMPAAVNLDPHENVDNYRRMLDLRDAVASVSFIKNGVTYKREAFASAPNEIMAFRFTADKPGSISFTAGLSRLADFETEADGESGLVMTGLCRKGTRADSALTYVARLRAVNSGGTVSNEGGVLKIDKADAVTLLVAAATDYEGFAGRNTKDPLGITASDIEKTAANSYGELKSAHINDHRSFFDRVSLSLSDANEESRKASLMPTDKRVAALAKGGSDPALAALYFNYGRYLLIGSSRPGTMPANLQGIWAEGTRTPWNCDFHIDINVQMNYWPAEVAGLGDCHTPLFKLIESLQEPGAKTAKAYYNADGWVAHVITNVWGFTAPGEQAGWGATATGSPWLCDHLWEHYDYTRDKAFLKWAYPIMKGSAEFFLDMLITDPKTGWLVTAPSNSPENTLIMPNGKKARVCMGPTMDMQILRELFENCIEAAGILGIDDDFRKKLDATRTKLAPTRIGKHGQIMEWLEDYDEAEPTHRHVSHLYGLHPYNEITPDGTPELAKAARVTLQRRGDRSTGWSMAWKSNFWARLHDGNHAEKLLSMLITRGGKNLLCQHPPFQIDGNFGGTSAIAEMLLQCHGDVIRLLPALPDAWPNGKVSKFRARGGYQVDIVWKDGKVTSYKIYGNEPGAVKVRVNGKLETVPVEVR